MRKLLFVSAMLLCQQLFSQSIIYVNHAATGANNGSSWTDAFNDFQDALDTARAGDQIWVAKGKYYPSKIIDSTKSTNKRAIAFQLVDSVEHYGGFNGTETLLSERDWRVNETILSGDIGNRNYINDNAITVVFNKNELSDKTVMDGFTIREGNWLYYYGSKNGYGGAAIRGDAVLRNLHLTKNWGWGLSAGDGVTIISCRIDSNVFYSHHWAYHLNDGCTGLNLGTQPKWAPPSKARVINCFIGNNLIGDITSSRTTGDVRVSGESQVSFEGCTFKNADAHNAVVINGIGRYSVTFNNCILNDSVVFSQYDTLHKVKFANSLVRYSSDTLYPGADLGGNIDTIPGFVSPGDYRLASNSPCIDAGSNDSIPLDVWDLDNDGVKTEWIPYDLSGNMRVVDGKIDIGAFEYMPSWSDTLYQTMCKGDSATYNGQTFRKEGIYKQAYTPDSAQYFNLNWYDFNLDVEVWFGGILESKADSVSYQWIDCNDTTNKLIATQKVFYPKQAGDYAVVLTAPNGCSDTSACYSVNSIGLTEQSLKDEFYFYPNPVKDILKIGFGEGQKVLNISIKNVSGQSLLTTQVQLQGQSEVEVNVEALPAGIYFLEVNGRVKRFVK